MMNTLAIFEDLSHYMDPQAARKIAETLGQVYDEITKTVTKTEFTELKDIVGELAQAQKKTEERIAELAQAQKDLGKGTGEDRKISGSTRISVKIAKFC